MTTWKDSPGELTLRLRWAPTTPGRLVRSDHVGIHERRELGQVGRKIMLAVEGGSEEIQFLLVHFEVTPSTGVDQFGLLGLWLGVRGCRLPSVRPGGSCSSSGLPWSPNARIDEFRLLLLSP